ncbi:MAG: hypothetical protein AAFQ79_17810 [Pseudomonadota bacterium]
MRNAAPQAVLLVTLAAAILACAPRDTVGKPALGVSATTEHVPSPEGEGIIVRIVNSGLEPVCVQVWQDPGSNIQLIDSQTRAPVQRLVGQGEPVEFAYSVPTEELRPGDEITYTSVLNPEVYVVAPEQWVRAVASFLVIPCDERDAEGGITFNSSHFGRSEGVTSSESTAFRL